MKKYPANTIPKTPEKQYYPVSLQQEGVWLQAALDPDRSVWNTSHSWRFEGTLDIDALKKAVHRLITRHAALRTNFRLIAEKIKQFIHPEISISDYFYYYDFLSYPDNEKERAAAALEKEIAQKPYDLEKEPLIRFTLMRLGQDDHVLVVGKHHIISDVASRQIMWRELSSLYKTCIAGGPGQLEPIDIQYHDYSVWQQEFINSDCYQKQKKYWLTQLPEKDSLPRLNLPTDFPRSETLAKVSNYRVILEPGLVEKLRTFSLRKRISFSAVFLAAYYILLSRYSGQDDIIIGTLYRGRNRDKKNLGKLIGLFVNHVALRLDLDGQFTSVELLENIHRKTAAAYDNQDFLFEDLLRTVHPERSGRYAPLLQVVFNMIKISFPAVALEGLKFKDWQGFELDTNITSHYDLSLFIRDDFKELSVHILYSQSLFSHGTIERMAAQYINLLADIMEFPQEHLADLEIITEEEKRQIIYEFNNTAASFPNEKTIHGLFEAQVEKKPDHIAIVGADPRFCPIHSAGPVGQVHPFHNLSLTYSELNKQSHYLAGLLVAKGVRVGDIAALKIERSIELVTVMLAVLKAGGAYLPIDPDYPQERIDYISKDCGVRILIDKTEIRNPKPGTNPNDQKINDQSKNSSNLAYIIYTSGSTGRPKGVPVKHEGFVNLIYYHRGLFGEGPGVRMSQAANPGFDAMAFEVWPCLTSGAALYIMDNETRLDPAKIKRWLIDKEIGISFQPTVMAELLLNENWPDNGVTLKILRTAGDKLTRYPARKYPFKLYNLYGPTEDTVWTTWTEVPVKPAGGIPPIGKPIANHSIYIMGPNLKLLPLCVPGELCIGGVGLAAGYLNRPELTFERFIDFHHSSFIVHHSLLYRTGDLARWRADGNVEFLGRIDHQVKIRGFRLELGEIETALNEHIGVKEAVVTTVTIKNEIPGHGVMQSLCAYMIPSGCGELDITALQEYLSKKLPAYMVPSYFIKMEKFPLTPNGKIDRKALPENLAGLIAEQNQDDYRAPQNEVQQALVSVWQEVLGIQKIGITDNFFTIGGESIKAIQVSSRLAAHGYLLDIALLFKYPSIQHLWEHVKKKETTGTADQNIFNVVIKPIPIQQWFLDQDFTHHHHWNLAMMLYREQRFEEEILKKVLDRLVEHHDALRVVLTPDGQSLFNKGTTPGEGGDMAPFLEVLDLRTIPPTQLAGRIESEANRIQASIDLYRGPLIKTILFKTVSGDHFFIAIHHLAIDGISWRILLEDISTGYEQVGEGREIVFPAKTHSFKQWSEALAAYSRTGKLRQEYDYWRGICTAATGKKENEKGKLKDYYRCKIELAEEESRLILNEAQRAYNTEINDLLLAALALALRDCFGRQQTVIHLEGHGREPIAGAIDIHRTVGWFTVLFPVLLEAREEDDLSIHIRRVKENLRRIPHHGIGYGILRYLADLPEADRQELAIESTVGFNYLGQFDADFRRTGFQRSHFGVGHSKSPESEQVSKININGLTEKSRLTFMINGDTRSFPAEQIENFARSFKNALQRIAGHCAAINETIMTPADFGTKDLGLDELETINECFDRHNIGKIYNLSPMQEGMLFHYMYDPQSRAYTVQLVYSLEGDVDAALLKKSYEKLVAGREIFRTAFIYKGIKRPRQVVLKTRESEFTDHDITGAADQDNRFKEISGQERERGFDLSKDILIRFTLIRTARDKYFLLATNHHIIMDGWSTNLWLKDFLDIYYNLKNNKEPRLEVAPAYDDYIKWLGEQDIGGAYNYWRNYLAGFERTTQLQTNQQNAGTDTKTIAYSRGEYAGKIAKETAAGLLELANRLGVTLNTVLQVIWGVVLSRHTAEEDIVFGNVISGRSIPLEGVEHITGLFINTIPLRLRINGAQNFEDFVRETGENFIECQSYGYLSLAEVQAQAPQIAGGGRLFEHLFIFENYPVNKELTGRGQAEKTGFTINRQFSIEHTDYDLNIVIIPRDDIIIHFQYNENIYNKSFVSILAGHLEQVMREVVCEPGRPISDIEIVTNEEKQLLLYEFNNTTAPYPEEKTIHELFADQVEKTPDYIAIIARETHEKFSVLPVRPVQTVRPVCLTYSELNEQSNSLAGLLIDKGVRTDSVVALKSERSIEMMIAIYGILKAGGAYLPIDPAYPQERVDYMLKDSGAEILIINSEIRNPKFVSNFDIRISNFNTSNLAYLIYTSGSTGKPKGVLIEHRSLVNRLNWMQKQYAIGHNDTILHKTPFTFDVSVWEIFWWSMAGARVCLLAPGGEKDPKQITAAIYGEHVTVMHFVPSMLRAFLEYIEQTGAAGRLSSLKQVIASGEALNAPLVNRFNEVLNKKNNVRLANLYGPTEATIDVSYYDCPREEKIEKIPIGKPIANTRLIIVNKGGRLQPVGTAGELLIGGVGLARGYLNRPEFTAERFNRAYQSDNAYIFYKTGDLACWLPDGNIEFLGRIDQQVKIRGFRIELGEIESRLNRHTAVKESVVIAVNDPGGENSLCAYIEKSAENHEELCVEHLRDYLSKILPEYMIPSYFITLEKIPLTNNGKVDRKSLPPPKPGKTLRSGAAYEKPRSEIEEKIVCLWQEILKIEKIGIHDNFFSLGGHSLKAMNFAGQVYQIFNLEIPLRIIFDTPTVSGIAQWIQVTMDKRRKLTQILLEIEALSDEQVIELISRENICYNNNGGLL